MQECDYLRGYVRSELSQHLSGSGGKRGVEVIGRAVEAFQFVLGHGISR